MSNIITENQTILKLKNITLSDRQLCDIELILVNDTY